RRSPARCPSPPTLRCTGSFLKTHPDNLLVTVTISNQTRRTGDNTLTSLSRTFTGNKATAIELRTRWGGPRRRRPTMTRYERSEHYLIDRPYGSHMSLDTSVHWDWRNPLNILPALLLFDVLLALVELVLV